MLNALRRVIARPFTPFDTRFRLRRTVSPFSTMAAAAADALFARSLAALPASTRSLTYPHIQLRLANGVRHPRRVLRRKSLPIYHFVSFLLINLTCSSMLLISPGSPSSSPGTFNANGSHWMSTSWQTHRRWRRLGWRRRLYYIPGTFHPRQWPLAWLCYSISIPSFSNSSLLDLSRTEKIGIHFRSHV